MSVTQSLTLTQSSQNVANNTSAVRILWTSTQAGQSFNNYTRTAKYYVSVNGGAEVEYGVSYTLPKGTTKTILDVTLTVNHKADGTGSIKVRTWMDTDISQGVIEQNKTLTLTTIPRATTPTLSATTADMGSQVTITLPRASSSFTHDLAYSFNGGSYTNMVTGVATSYKWTIPDFSAQIPNGVSGQVTIRCITKSGSTTIGTKTVSLTARLPSNVIPDVTSITITEAVSGIAEQFGAYVQNKSRLSVVVKSGGSGGSTITNVQTTIMGKKYTGASITSDVLTVSGTVTVSVQVTDSRGRTSPVWTQNVTVLAYSEPRIHDFDAYRVDETGNADTSGDYLALRYKYEAPAMDGGNVVTKSIEYKAASSSGFTSLVSSTDKTSEDVLERPTSPTFPTDNSYVLRLTVTDYFGASAFREVEVPTGDVILDINATGKGIAFRKVSERNGVEMGTDVFDEYGQVIANGMARYTGSGPIDGINANTTLDRCVVTDHNAPGSTFGYIETVFYGDKTEQSNRAQIALPYNADRSLYIRRCYNEEWSNWMEAPVKVDSGTSGIWTYVKWSDKTVELWGVYSIANTDCSTALGNMYRTALLSPTAFPFSVASPKLVASYESNGYGALLWPTGNTSTTRPPTYYLVRPTAGTIANGKIVMHVTGTVSNTSGGGASSGAGGT